MKRKLFLLGIIVIFLYNYSGNYNLEIASEYEEDAGPLSEEIEEASN